MAAAAAIVAVLIGFGHRPPVAPSGLPIIADIGTPAPPARTPTEVAVVSIEPTTPRTETRATTEPVADGIDAAALALTDADRRAEAQRRQVRELLDRPELFTMLVVNDIPGGDAPRRIGVMLEKTPMRHARFGRLTLSQGVIIDPARPGKATVYAVVMEESELREFSKTLRMTFPEVMEAEPRPEVVTQLAEVDDLSVIEGRAVANLIVPDGPARAVRVENHKDVVKNSVADPANGQFYRPGDGAAASDVPAKSAAGGRLGQEVADNGAASKRPRQPSAGSNPFPAMEPEKGIEVDRHPRELVVLIWVSSPPLLPDEGRFE